MKITIEVIPHATQRYPTAGDWFFDAAGSLTIRVSALGDWKKEALVAVHELVEVLICKAHGVTQQQVDDFDFAYIGEDGEPGNDPNAPYYQEHQFASGVEQLLAQQLGVVWNEYNKDLDEL